MESEPNFSESTTVSSIYAESETRQRNVRDIYVGHLEELHYVSTTPIRHTAQYISTEMNYQTTSKRKQYTKVYVKARKKERSDIKKNS